MNQSAPLPAAIAEVFITDRLASRPETPPDYLREKLAIQDLANEMAEHPGDVLPRLVKLAMEICEAESAGVSVLDAPAKVFRCLGLQGALSVFEGATKPRSNSPCGVCLDQQGAILMQRPERIYDWIREANIAVPELLLVPLFMKGGAQLGTLWVVARDGQAFNAGHARILTELDAFTGIAQAVGNGEHILDPVAHLLGQRGLLVERRLQRLLALAKHGALGMDGGRVSVCWRQDADRITVDWQENGGPSANMPDKQGFGATLIKSTLASLGAEIIHHWNADGLRVVITAPLNKLQD